MAGKCDANTHVDMPMRSLSGRKTVRLAILAVAVALLLWGLVIALGDGFIIHTSLGTFSSRRPSRPFLAAAALVILYAASLRGNSPEAVRRLAKFPWPKVIATTTPIAAFVIGVNYSAFLGAGPDSSGYVSQAHKWVNGDLRSPIPEWAIRGTFGGAYAAGAPVGYTVAADGQSYVPVYSPGLPLIMSLFERAGGADAVFYVVPLFGALLVWGTYLLGRQLADEWAGAIGAALMLLSPAFLWLLIEPMSDVPVAACWTMALVLAIGANTTMEAFSSGVASGLAILIRPNVAPLAMFPALLLFLSDKRRLKHIVLFGMPTVLAAVVIATINARWYGSPFMSGYGSVDALYSSDRIPLNLRRYTGWLIDTQTPFVFLWVAAPFVVKAYDIGRRFVLLLLYPFAVVAMYLAYLNVPEWGYLRFLLPAYPVVLASLAATLVIFARNAPHRRLAVAAAATITVLLLFHEERFARNAGAFRIAEGEERFARAVDFTRALPPNAIVFSDAYSGTLGFYAQREVLRWLWIPPEYLDLALGDLKKQGHHPYFVGDPFEVEAFKQYFDGSAAVTRLDGQALRVVDDSFVAADLTPP
ncbi:MAG TPA: glycosyltransferase family 39 protein [Vicinamibacterales bacterium]|nr:glycosyltransferase family 39 protein [Vicinamibacterales bacterium]